MGLAKRIRTVTELKARTAKLLDQVNEERAPLIITQDGVARGVLMDVESYDRLQQSLTLLKLVAQGEEDLRRGRSVPHEERFDRIGRKHGWVERHARGKTQG
jgi:prevent-host-death family protein